MSIDHAGEYVASCSFDGRVVIRSVMSSANDAPEHVANTDRPVKSVAIDPIYARANSGKRYMIGERGINAAVLWVGFYNQLLFRFQATIASLSMRSHFSATAPRKYRRRARGPSSP